MENNNMFDNNFESTDEHPLRLIGITYNQIESGVYALVLEEVNGKRRIPIVIGYPEAQAIECKLQEVASPRPLTHDLIINMLENMDAFLEKVVIRRLPTGVFAAYLYIRRNDGKRLMLDARSSDAIAIAIRCDAPIYTSSRVLEEAGFLPTEKKEAVSSINATVTGMSSLRRSSMSDYASMPREKLIKLMEEAVRNENYEKAAEIKKFIDELGS